MPLTRHPSCSPYNGDMFSVTWPMKDGEKQVNITVSSDTLEDMASERGMDATAGPIPLWNEFRDLLEATAARKYEDDESTSGPIHVTLSDTQTLDDEDED